VLKYKETKKIKTKNIKTKNIKAKKLDSILKIKKIEINKTKKMKT